ncbi:MAG: heavy metal-associated domain-containing protein [Kofleriaceae bacterium]
MVTTLRINGMTCNGCVKHVDAALRGVAGVSAVEVTLAEQRAKVVHDPERSPLPSLVAAVTAAGYEAAAEST